MGCLSSENLKEGKVGTTSLLTLVPWTIIVKLPNFAGGDDGGPSPLIAASRTPLWLR